MLQAAVNEHAPSVVALEACWECDSLRYFLTAITAANAST